uniref:Alpha-1,3-mannosyl-glycoprotein 4-beta-N-acetylglucosaminyltransferase A n=1 Tax=Syphacia muris TaxID=451379 RepID=A0A0N5AIV6_9BILA
MNTSAADYQTVNIATNLRAVPSKFLAAQTSASSLLHSENPLNTKIDLISLPSILDQLPYLKSRLQQLNPAEQFPNSTILRNFDVVIGIPTVDRNGVSYLSRTLQSILFGLSRNSEYKVLVVVMYASDNETSSEVRKRVATLNDQFQDYFDSGLLHVIVPPKAWYPDNLHNIEPTLGDSPERMYWRTKQNLDYLYLMLFCEPLGKYYLQLEDDIITKDGFITEIMHKAELFKSHPWFLIEFSSLGFIGKLFRHADLKYLAQFIALLYRYKPVDWILDTVFYDRYCLPFMAPKNCSKAFKKYRLRGPTLFQHIGLTSSLHGKVQKLKEKTFKETMSFIPHTNNPPAKLISTLPYYLNYTFEQLYIGHSAFWSSRTPVKGDVIELDFPQAVGVKSILLRSGNAEHPDDTFNNETAVKCVGWDSSQSTFSSNFNNVGVAQVLFNSTTLLRTVMVEVNSNHSHWIVLSELFINHEP